MNSMSLTLSEIALEILRERYLRRDEAGKLVESPEGMLNRVAGAIAEPARSFGEDAAFCPGQSLSVVDEGARPDCRDCAV